MNNPLISIIIPTYNRAQYLVRAIDSVLKQSYRNWELIIIDDASDDRTEEIIASYLKNPQITYQKLPFNKGVSHARNRGVDKALGEWIAFLDSDDEWLPHKLQEQLTLWHERPDLRVIHGEEIWIRAGKRVNQKKIHQKFGGQIFEKCLPLCLISPSCVMLEKSLYLEMGGFDEDFIVCEDYDLWLKITSLYEVGFVKDPIIKKYGGHEDQLSARYRAMDFYRVKALERILRIRELGDEWEKAVCAIMVKKASILKQGYIKHNNNENLAYVDSLLKRFSKETEYLS